MIKRGHATVTRKRDLVFTHITRNIVGEEKSMFLCQILINSCIILMFSPIHYCSSEKTHATGLVPENPFSVKVFCDVKTPCCFYAIAASAARSSLRSAITSPLTPIYFMSQGTPEAATG